MPVFPGCQGWKSSLSFNPHQRQFGLKGGCSIRFQISHSLRPVAYPALPFVGKPLIKIEAGR
jgi:hypothetical protein